MKNMNMEQRIIINDVYNMDCMEYMKQCDDLYQDCSDCPFKLDCVNEGKQLKL